MTVHDYQVELVNIIRNHGPERPLYFIDPATGERLDIILHPRVSAEGVYLEVVPVRRAQPVEAR